MQTPSVIALVLFIAVFLFTLISISFLLGSLSEIRIGLHAVEPADVASNHRLTLIGDDAVHHNFVLHALLLTVIAIALGVFAYGMSVAGGPPAGLSAFAGGMLLLALLGLKSRARAVEDIAGRFTQVAGFTPSEGRQRVLGPRPTPVLPG